LDARNILYGFLLGGTIDQSISIPASGSTVRRMALLGNHVPRQWGIATFPGPPLFVTLSLTFRFPFRRLSLQGKAIPSNVSLLCTAARAKFSASAVRCFHKKE
jgi:hypothetical protein